MDNFNWYWGKMIQQTTQEKKKAYTEQGIPYQQGTTRYGYKRVGKQGNAHLEIVTKESKIVDDITRWFDEGIGVADIQRRLEGKPTPGDTRGLHIKVRPYGTWSKMIIYDILKDEIYAGTYYANRWKIIETETGKKKRILRPKEEWVPIPVPAIISRDRWERNQNRLAEGQSAAFRPHYKYEYLVARHAMCRLCGCRMQCMTIRTIYGEKSYYMCNARFAKLAKGKCKLPYFQVKRVDEEVWKVVKKLLSDTRALRTTLEEAQVELRRQQDGLYQQIAEVDELITQRKEELNTLAHNLRQVQGPLLIEAVQRQANDIAQTIQGLEAQKARLEAKLKPNIITDEEIAALEEYAEKIQPRLPYATFQDKRDIIEALKFSFEFTIEGNEKVLYVLWHSYEFRLTIGTIQDFYASSTKMVP